MLFICFLSIAQKEPSLKTMESLVYEKLKKGDFEGAWALADNGEALAQKREHFDSLAIFIKTKAIIQDNTGNNLESVKLGMRALQLTRTYHVSPRIQVDILFRLSISHRTLKEYDRALTYLREANLLVKENASFSNMRGQLLASFGAIYVSNGDLDSAAIYLIDRVKVLPERVKEETKFKANLNYWLSRLFEEREEFDKAIYHLNITTNIDSINKSFTQYSSDRFQLAELLYGKSDLSEAIRVYTECLQTASRNGDLRLEYSSLKGLYNCFLGEEDSLKALKFLIECNDASDSLFVLNKIDEIRGLEFSHQIELVELKKQLELERLSTAEERSRLITWITVISSIIVIATLVLIGIFLWKRSRRKLMFKKKEVALYTAEISSKNEAINIAVESLNKQISETGNNPELRSTLNDLKFELKNEDLWKDLEVRFRDVQSKFYRVLLQKHPDLTKNEVRLCSFVKLQLTTKEITALTKKSIGSVNVAKHRLKKKMDIPENQTLYSYVNSELFN
jgi:tetratricopeptide (TPR) repeat protein